MQQRSLEVNGIVMRWEEEGQGEPPVVLVHGIPTSPRLWRHVVPYVAGVRCLAWEMVGYGASIPEGRNRDISVRRQAEYLLSWLDALDIKRAVLVGHDLGGGVVQRAALQRPELCAGLCLTNTIGYDSWPIRSVKAVRMTGGLVARMPDKAFRKMFDAFLRRGHDDEQRASESISVHWAPYAAHDGAAAFVRQARSLDVHDTLDVADRLTQLKAVPSRVVWGVADQFQKVAYGERLAHDLQAPLESIHGGKHFTPEDHPQQVARAINEVVEEAQAGAH